MRGKWELEAYKINLALKYDLYGDVSDGDIEFVVSQFTSMMYVWMYPFPDKIRKNLNDFRQELRDGKIDYRKLLRME